MAQEQPDGRVMVELVDPQGNTIGLAEKLEAHQPPGQLHRAFSVFLLDDEGRVLMQRRALTKYHSPGRWSNTCCSHPFPGEEPREAVLRRLSEELGAKPTVLESAGLVTYDVTDEVSGLVEKEFNHLFVGLAGGDLGLNPEEVDDVAFVPLAELDAWLAAHEHTAWLSAVLDPVREPLAALAAR
ncbi:isopentenyl-diphosphate Delta-isomerase [Embleya sp. NPDC005575]|uniref:isopentenyl-diphosphate Delta-isomerase n=1 Tax=Embleya sp. NPDC005575 TaxID=3156892 RepID=UPI0033AAAED2